jgi:ABC-type branched-subunit amino acid transport system ATPase component
MASSSRSGVLAPPTTRQALALVNVEVIYNQVILVLRGLSLTVGEGEIVALLGSNGAGKSTTLKAISGLLPSEDGEVTQGEILHEGEPIGRRDAAEIVRRGISLVMEGRRIFEHLTAEENIQRLNDDLGATILVVEQNARLALEVADRGYVMENGRIVLDGPADQLARNPDVQEFYLGLTESGERRSYRDVKHYKRRKRWL